MYRRLTWYNFQKVVRKIQCYIFDGLPATGKTEISRYLATTMNAAYVRIDSIEQGLKEQGFKKLYDEGYQIAFLVALGVSVVPDSANPVKE